MDVHYSLMAIVSECAIAVKHQVSNFSAILWREQAKFPRDDVCFVLA
jgi:hypothetical protein